MTLALVLGGARTVWDDVGRALRLARFHVVVACNDVVAAWPGRLDAAVSLHPEKFGIWCAQRAANGYVPPERVIGHDAARSSLRKVPDCVTGWAAQYLPGQDHSGSSGLFALKYALIDLACEKAVLCGVPMTHRDAHFFDRREWGGAIAHRRGWNKVWAFIGPRTRSMSGWTAEQLGEPDTDWLGASAL